MTRAGFHETTIGGKWHARPLGDHPIARCGQPVHGWTGHVIHFPLDRPATEAHPIICRRCLATLQARAKGGPHATDPPQRDRPTSVPEAGRHDATATRGRARRDRSLHRPMGERDDPTDRGTVREGGPGMHGGAEGGAP